MTPVLPSAVLLSILISVSAQQQAGPPTLEQQLVPVFSPPNDAFFSIFPISILTGQTPTQARFTLIYALAGREVYAACDDTALSFFGHKARVSASFCEGDSFARLLSYTVRRSLARDFPVEMTGYATFLISAGLTPFDPSTDISTEIGWANVNGGRISDYFANDGWNSLGLSKFFPARFADTSGYKPRNPAHLEPSQLRVPLRWQPLTQSYDGNGNFASQVHIMPHIGVKARPFSLTRAEFHNRRAKRLYKQRDSPLSLSPHDERRVRNLIDELLVQNRRMTARKLTIARWWDDKFSSIGTFILYYMQVLQLSPKSFYSMWAAEIIAVHDAVLVAWKEKRRSDLARPETLMRHLLGNKSISAWRGFEHGVGPISVSEWEPAVRTMPHSEYPSASALICEAALENIHTFAQNYVPANSSVPPFEAQLSPGLHPLGKSITLKYDSLHKAAYHCGQSRLWTGLHFRPAVGQGYMLGKGIGKKSFHLIRNLDEGRVPARCHWCKSQ